MAKIQEEKGTTEIVDTFIDIINAIARFLETFKGPFNLMRFLGWAIETYPRIEEAVNDFGTFWAEIEDLTPQEALDATAQIEIGVTKTPVTQKIVDVLKLLALAYDFFAKTRLSIDLLIKFAAGIFRKAA